MINFIFNLLGSLPIILFITGLAGFALISHVRLLRYKQALKNYDRLGPRRKIVTDGVVQFTTSPVGGASVGGTANNMSKNTRPTMMARSPPPTPTPSPYSTSTGQTMISSNIPRSNAHTHHHHSSLMTSSVGGNGLQSSLNINTVNNTSASTVSYGRDVFRHPSSVLRNRRSESPEPSSADLHGPYHPGYRKLESTILSKPRSQYAFTPMDFSPAPLMMMSPTPRVHFREDLSNFSVATATTVTNTIKKSHHNHRQQQVQNTSSSTLAPIIEESKQNIGTFTQPQDVLDEINNMETTEAPATLSRKRLYLHDDHDAIDSSTNAYKQSRAVQYASVSTSTKNNSIEDSSIRIPAVKRRKAQRKDEVLVIAENEEMLNIRRKVRRRTNKSKSSSRSKAVATPRSSALKRKSGTYALDEESQEEEKIELEEGWITKEMRMKRQRKTAVHEVVQEKMNDPSSPIKKTSPVKEKSFITPIKPKSDSTVAGSATNPRGRIKLGQGILKEVQEQTEKELSVLQTPKRVVGKKISDEEADKKVLELLKTASKFESNGVNFESSASKPLSFGSKITENTESLKLAADLNMETTKSGFSFTAPPAKPSDKPALDKPSFSFSAPNSFPKASTENKETSGSPEKPTFSFSGSTSDSGKQTSTSVFAFNATPLESKVTNRPAEAITESAVSAFKFGSSVTTPSETKNSTETTAPAFSFGSNIKPNEESKKFDSVQPAAPVFSFGQKSEDKPSTNESKTASATPFSFGATTTGKENENVPSSTATSSFTFGQKPAEEKPKETKTGTLTFGGVAGGFSFGSTSAAASGSSSITAGPTTAATTSSTTSNTRFSHGTPKVDTSSADQKTTSETPKCASGFSFGMTSSTPTAPAFSFGITGRTTTTTASATEPSAAVTESKGPSFSFGTTTTTPVGAGPNSTFSFGASSSNQDASKSGSTGAPSSFSFATPTAQGPLTSSTTTGAPAFAFGSGSTGIVNPFGSSTTTSAPAPNSSQPSIGGFGASASTTSGFGFGSTSSTASSQPTTVSDTTAPAFSFGTSSGTNVAAPSSTSAPSFSFGQSTSTTPSGGSTAPTLAFGSSIQNTTAPANPFGPAATTTGASGFQGFGQQPQASTAAPSFQFGASQPAPAANTFGGQPQQSVPVFGGAPSTSAQAFNFGAASKNDGASAAPSFNFGASTNGGLGGSSTAAPFQFNAGGAPAAGGNLFNVGSTSAPEGRKVAQPKGRLKKGNAGGGFRR